MYARQWLHTALLIALCTAGAHASVGDRLPEFQECVSICIDANCQHGNSILPLHLRLLLWTCPQNCDYTCQHIITAQRLSTVPAIPNPIVQYHGKWPFTRFAGLQEPCSVLFSLFNLLAHRHGLRRLRAAVPSTYPLRKYYSAFGYIGIGSWVFSMIFHARDFSMTEKADYFAAGASVLYGLFMAPVRILRLERPTKVRQSALRAWTATCAALYTAHVAYLSLWRWDYGYNMAANVAVGAAQNVLWTAFSVCSYSALRKSWAAWPGLIVAWLVLAMSLELLDFPPLGGAVDAHSLWHLATVGPTVWWYSFLIKDAQQDMAGSARLKA